MRCVCNGCSNIATITGFPYCSMCKEGRLRTHGRKKLGKTGVEPL